MTEDVPFTQCPAPNFDVTCWETQNNPLSAELLTRFSLTHSGIPTLQLTDTPALRHAATLASTPAQPSACARGRTIISTLKRCTLAARKAQGLSLLTTEACSIYCQGMPNFVWSCRKGKKRSALASKPNPDPIPKSSRCDRRGEAERETQSPLPLLIWENNTRSLVGEGQLLSFSARSRSRVKSRQTRWHIDLLLWEEKTEQSICCTLLGLIQYLDSSWATTSIVCAHVCMRVKGDCRVSDWMWFSLERRSRNAAPTFTPAWSLWRLAVPGISGKHYHLPAGREAALWEVLERDFQGCGHPKTRECHCG